MSSAIVLHSPRESRRKSSITGHVHFGPYSDDIPITELGNRSGVYPSRQALYIEIPLCCAHSFHRRALPFQRDVQPPRRRSGQYRVPGSNKPDRLEVQASSFNQPDDFDSTASLLRVKVLTSRRRSVFAGKTDTGEARPLSPNRLEASPFPY